MSDKKTLRVQDYIQHILAAIERIETYVEGFDLTAFNRSFARSGCGYPQFRNYRRGRK